MNHYSAMADELDKIAAMRALGGVGAQAVRGVGKMVGKMRSAGQARVSVGAGTKKLRRVEPRVGAARPQVKARRAPAPSGSLRVPKTGTPPPQYTSAQPLPTNVPKPKAVKPTAKGAKPSKAKAKTPKSPAATVKNEAQEAAGISPWLLAGGAGVGGMMLGRATSPE